MNYTLHQLQVFVTVVKIKHISKAAEELHMTQPAVSIQLKNFLSQFDVPLLETIHKRIHITDAGYEVYELGRAILNDVEQIHHRMLARKGLLSGKISFVSVSTGKYIIPYFIAPFVKQFPYIEFKMDVRNRHRSLQMLQQQEADFALVSVLPDELDVEEEWLMPNYLWLVAAPESQKKYTKGRKLDPEVPVIYREAGSGTRLTLERYISKTGIQPKVMLELESTEAIKQAVLAGLGFSILSLYSMRHELHAGEITLIKAPGFPLQTDWRIIWLKGKKLSPATDAFIRFIREEKDRIKQQLFQWIHPYLK
jgi:DNA-binding transcriptional LysR family regulator